MVKKILSILLWAATAASLIVLFAFARKDYLRQPIQDIKLIPQSENGFVRKQELHDDLERICGQVNIGAINMMAIQKYMSSNPWIESSTSFVGLDGALNISYIEHNPQFRVFDKNGNSVYVTDQCTIIPSSLSYTPYVPIASGNFNFNGESAAYQLCDTMPQDLNLIRASHLLKNIEKNNFIQSCIGQIYCNEQNEFELTVRGLDAKVIFGDTCDTYDKLKKLEIFLKQRANSLETKSMKSINLKYKNQIVCTKR